MELDDLKDTWTQYDKKLTENLKLNEELLRKMNLNNSKREMQKPLIYELTGIAITFFAILWLVALSIKLIGEPKYSVPGFVSATVGVVYFIFGIIRANRFLNIDYYGSSVVRLQKDLALLNKLVLYLRKFELILIPVLVLLALPLLFKFIHNIDIYSNIKLFIIEIVLILGFGYPLTFWINKHLYDNKFKSAIQLLTELEKFEKEE